MSGFERLTAVKALTAIVLQMSDELGTSGGPSDGRSGGSSAGTSDGPSGGPRRCRGSSTPGGDHRCEQPAAALGGSVFQGQAEKVDTLASYATTFLAGGSRLEVKNIPAAEL